MPIGADGGLCVSWQAPSRRSKERLRHRPARHAQQVCSSFCNEWVWMHAMMTDVNDVREARQPRNQGFSLAWHIGADSGLCLVAGTFSEQAAASCSACPAGLLLLMHRTCLDCISHEGLPPSRPESGQPAWVLMSLCLSLWLCLSLCLTVSVSVSESQSFC